MDGASGMTSCVFCASGSGHCAIDGDVFDMVASHNAALSEVRMLGIFSHILLIHCAIVVAYFSVQSGSFF